LVRHTDFKEPEMAERVWGPASYFPSIVAKYGRSIPEWMALMRASGLTSHKELVEWLKSEHGFGHGHANALVGFFLARGSERLTVEEQVASLFPAAKAHWRPVYDRLVAEIYSFGAVRTLPKNNLVGFRVRHQFAMLQPSTPDRFDVGLKLRGVEATPRLEAAGAWNSMMTHRVRVTDPNQVDEELLGWLHEAYDSAL
jgi:hypothetical protein